MMEYVLEFDEFIRSVKQNVDTKFSMLLGAGASVESGIPTASDCIWEWKRDIFISQNPALVKMYNNIKSESVRNSIQHWLDNQGIYPALASEEEYSKYVEKAYKIPSDRKKYFQHIIEGKSPSLGYHIIALLAETEIIKSVWTTNFDGLMVKTAHQYDIVPIEVTLESQDRVFRNDAEKELLCIALHGDYKYGPLKNTEEELDNQSDILIKALSHETVKRNFIVVGYSGRDNSLMEAIEAAYDNVGVGRLYWCGYGRDIPKKVQNLIDKINRSGREAFYIPTDGFDKTMLNMVNMCFEKVELRNRVERLKETLGAGFEDATTPFVENRSGINKCIDTNLFPITFPKQCYQFKIRNYSTQNLWDYCKSLMQYNIVAIPYDGMIYAWGNINTINKICANELVGSVGIAPVAKETFVKNASFREMLLRAIVVIIGKHAHCSFNRNKIWDSNDTVRISINGKSIVAYKGVKLSLFSDKRYNYISLTPSFQYANNDTLSRDERQAFSKKFVEDICQMQANKNYHAYLSYWKNIIFNKGSIKAMYPYGSESGFEFQIISRTLLVGVKSKSGTQLPKESDKGRVKLGGNEILDANLKFYNPSYEQIEIDFHPMRGLVKNMPYDYEMNNKVFKSTISLGVISPPGNLAKLETFLDGLNKVHTTRKNIDYVIEYPGFHNIYGVGLNVPLKKEWSLLETEGLSNHELYESARSFGDQINKKIELLDINNNIDVVMIYIPKEYEVFTAYENDKIKFNLHDYVKAYAVQKHISTQFIREQTLDSELDCQIAWAISLAIYVKAGRTPWVLANLREDTAFAGIGYSIDHTKNGEQILVGCSHLYAADGQGLKYKLSKIKDVTFDKHNNPYLSESEAYQLGINIKELFFSSFLDFPKRVVIHKRTPFKESEKKGLIKCLGSAGITDVDLVEITYEENLKCFSLDYNLYIDGYPVKRGCCFAVNDNTAYLYTHGIAPSVYSPARKYMQGIKNLPAPLKIVKHYGKGDLSQIAAEILGLSKMNWNSFGLYSKLPCTIQSASAIAKVGWLLPECEGMVYDYRNFM